MEHKYITVSDGLSIDPVPIIFDSRLNHSSVAHGLTVESAGMCHMGDDGKWYCYGKSTTLGIGSKSEDNDILNATFKRDRF